LHDGAVVIVNNRIRAARCILPVSGNRNISHDLGLRHRSAMGITEQSDAIAIVVSEQTGKISYCKKGELTLDIQPSQLKDFLEEEFNIIG
jgi:DNA integrity scanning protein DisA with diadenylate cyclase activity